MPPFDDGHYMALALAQARLAAQAGEVPVGAVLVHEGVVVAATHNRTVSDHDPTAHAEVLALRQGGRHMGNHRLEGCELYVTLEPCAMCAQAIAHARLARVVYGAPEPRTGAAGSVVDILGDPRLNPHTQVQAGVAADESAGLLKAFFEARRADIKRNAQPLRDDALRVSEPVLLAWARDWPLWSRLQPYSVFSTGVPGLQGLRLHHMDRPATAGASPDALPWLCLHGPGAWWVEWASWLAQPPNGCRVLVPDLIGHGQSDKPKKARWHSLDRHAQVLRDWLDSLRVDKVELVVAPGQEALAGRLSLLAPARVHWQGVPVQADTSGLPPGWADAPCPDKGHKAAWQAWAAGLPDGSHLAEE